MLLTNATMSFILAIEMVLDISLCFFQKTFQCNLFLNFFWYVQPNKDSLKIMSHSKGEGWKNYKAFSILRQMIHVSKSEVWEKGTEILLFRTTPFLSRIISLHLYRYLSQTSVRIILDCIYVFQDPRCIVSQDDFHHKILNWSTPPPFNHTYK